MRSIIIVNGDPPAASDINHWLRDGDVLLCADGGARAAMALGLQPRCVIGDFDSLNNDDLQRLAHQGTELQRHPVHKNETDLELALLYAVSIGSHEIIVLGALGGRFDHSNRSRFANITDKGGSVVLTYWPSEFTGVRGQYRFTRYAGAIDVHEFLMQMQFSLGAHGAHPF